MNKGFNIICRNGRYYFRARVPARLAAKVGIREIKKSLNTTNLTEARRRARPLQNFVSELKVMSNMDDILKQLRNAGVNTDRLTHKIKRLSIGDLLIEGLEVDPNNEADIEATERVIKAAATFGSKTGINKPLKDGIAAYVDEMVAGKNWSERTLAENRGIYNFLLKMIGENITCNLITHDTARTVKSLLLKLPSNFEKKAKYKGKTIAQVIALNDEPRTISTVNKTLIRYSSLFNYLKKNGYVAENVFADITIKQRKNVKDERRPFTDDELKKLFTHLSESNLKHAYQRFVPLIALYSGMRLEEICQLYKTDIKQTSCGIWYFDVTTVITSADDKPARSSTDDEKKLKNDTSKRQVPLHPLLTSLNLGFLDYVDSVRGDRLFPELKKISHRYSHAASRWFTDTRKKLGLVVPKGEPLLDFHSFRHNISTQLTHKDIPEYVIAGLLGQAYGKSESGRRYAKVPPPEHSINYLEKLHFDIPI